MAYSKVEHRIWHDERFRAWARETRYVWIYLLTNPHMDGAGGKVGMYVLDPAYAAADLSAPDEQWTGEKVTAELVELDRQGRILWDPETNLVLLKNFLVRNHPENPNVAKSAARDLEELPYSDRLWRTLRALVRKHTQLRVSRPKRGIWCGHIVAAIDARTAVENSVENSEPGDVENRANAHPMPRRGSEAKGLDGSEAKGFRRHESERVSDAVTTSSANNLGGAEMTPPRKGSDDTEPKGSNGTSSKQPLPKPSISTSPIESPTGSSTATSAASAREGRLGRPGRAARPDIDRTDHKLDGWEPDRSCRRTAEHLEKDLDFELKEFRRANQRHGTRLQNPDAAFMAWLKKPRRTVPTPSPGSEAEVARSAEAGNKHRAKDRMQEARQRKASETEAARVQEIEESDPDAAAAIRKAVQHQVDQDPNWSETPAGIRQRVANSLYRRRLLEEVS